MGFWMADQLSFCKTLFDYWFAVMRLLTKAPEVRRQISSKVQGCELMIIIFALSSGFPMCTTSRIGRWFVPASSGWWLQPLPVWWISSSCAGNWKPSNLHNLFGTLGQQPMSHRRIDTRHDKYWRSPFFARNQRFLRQIATLIRYSNGQKIIQIHKWPIYSMID